MKEFCIFLLLLLLPTLTSGKEPGVAAMNFLEKVRKGELNLEPGGDTALQSTTTKAKLNEIRNGIRKLGADLRGGELELGEVKKDTDFAAVMIRKVSGFDPSEIRIYPVALVKRDEEWLPAPVLASFENAVTGYTLPIGQKISHLEDWMMRKRVSDLGELIATAAQRTRDRIKESVIGENLEGDDIGKITDAFMKACASKDRAAVLGFLGGLSDPFPEDWPERLAASQLAVAGRGAWRLLVAPEVVCIPVLEERTNRSGMVSFACLDPSIGDKSGTLGKIRIIHIELQKDGSGIWRMDLPSVLMIGDEERLGDGEDLDLDLLDLFPKKLRELDPLVGAPTARDSLKGVMEALKSESVRDLLRRVDLGKVGKEGRIACSEAAKLWWSLNETGALRLPIELGFKEEGNFAAASFQWFSVNDPDRFELTTLFFRKSADGWVWCPGIVTGEERDGHKVLSDWLKANEPDWRLSWRGELMKAGTSLDQPDFARLATDEEVAAILADWMDALGRKDIRHAFSLSAWLGGDHEIPTKALRNLSYDLANYKKGDWQIERIHRSDSWVAASVRQVVEGKVRNALVPVVITSSGARLLPEIDLFAEDNRTRNFLNQASFERLGKFSGKQRVEELKALFVAFEKSLSDPK